MAPSGNLKSESKPLTPELAAKLAISEFGDEAAGYAAMCADYCFVCGYTSEAVLWAKAADLIKQSPNTAPLH